MICIYSLQLHCFFICTWLVSLWNAVSSNSCSVLFETTCQPVFMSDTQVQLQLIRTYRNCVWGWLMYIIQSSKCASDAVLVYGLSMSLILAFFWTHRMKMKSLADWNWMKRGVLNWSRALQNTALSTSLSMSRIILWESFFMLFMPAVPSCSVLTKI